MLTSSQQAKLRAHAEEIGVDPDELVREAESISGGSDDGETSSESAEVPPLYMYHLPFVTVREVRQRWLGLTDAFPGDSEIAAQWAAKIGAPKDQQEGE